MDKTNSKTDTRGFTHFNFLVEIGEEKESRVEAGFQECSTLTASADSVALKRGAISATGYEKLVGKGDFPPAHTVTIHLQNETHTATEMSCRLVKARGNGSLPARGTFPVQIAMEEIVLVYERLQIEVYSNRIPKPLPA